MADPNSSSLLARLNALRPTPVTLHPSTPSFHSAPEIATIKTATAPSAYPDTETDLAARFARLNGTSQLNLSQQHHIAEEATEYPAEDEPSLDDLLQELHHDSSWQVGVSDKDEARNLVAEARLALSDAAQVQQEQEKGDGHHQAKDRGLAEKDDTGTETRQPTEDEEADEYIQQALAAAALEGLDGNDDEIEDEHASIDIDSEFTLPSAPTTLHAPAQGSTDTASIFEFPSAPISVPITKVVTPSSKPKPAFADEEIETWCIICSDDATVRCLGCDSDLYCSNCWNEGHRGPDAGYEEKMHKAVRFVKPGGEVKGKARRMVGAA